jgi:hypothetical protein
MMDYLKQTDPLVKRFRRTSTALDYFPFLLNMYAYDIGMHPYVEVWDVGSELRNGNVVLTTPKGDVEVTPDTILVWK